MERKTLAIPDREKELASNNEESLQILSVKELDDDDNPKGVDKSGRENGSACSRKQKRGDDDVVYTVEEAIERMGFGPFQILITAFAGMIWVSVETASLQASISP